MQKVTSIIIFKIYQLPLAQRSEAYAPLVCVRVSETERETDRGRERQREREAETEKGFDL